MPIRFLTLLCLGAGGCLAGPMTDFGLSEIRKVAPSVNVTVSIDKALGPGAYSIHGTAITGGDERGAMHGALDYADQLAIHGKAGDRQVRPSLPVRALKFNIPLPGTGYLSEEDLAHNQWFWDLGYWREFLDMAARNRYNALTFWSAHPFDRMTRIPKYPEATDLPAAELDRNIAFFRNLFDMAAARGLDVYLITWNIHVSRSFARRHNVPALGFDSPLVRDYQREAIKALFATYPNLTGIGTTVGERMQSMTTRQKLDWIADTYFAALRQIGSKSPFILRYWQSEPDEMARMIERVRYAGPVYLDIKFNGEHMYSSVRPHVQDQRWSKLAPGHWKLLWHLRNDCLFILRWGDPDFVRQTVENMGGPDSAGFVEGSELDIPGVDRIHTPESRAHVDWRYKFEKHWFRFMLWGRLGFNAAEPDTTWRAHYARRFGRNGPDIYEATRQASKIIPLITSYHWNYMNGDWYPEGSIGSWNTSHEQPRNNYRRAAMYHDVRTYIFNNTIDASLRGIPEETAGRREGEGPLQVAARLEQYGRRALELAAKARPERGEKEFACTKLDLEAAGNLGIYYAEKLRGAAALAQVVLNGDEGKRAEAVRRLTASLDAWKRVAAATSPHYITHEVWLFGQFDWTRYTPAVERDIALAREMKPFRTAYALEGMHEWLRYWSGLRDKPAAAASARQMIRVKAADAASVTAPMKLENGYVVFAAPPRAAGGESITGERDFISMAGSATFNFEAPADGAYDIWVRAWWPEPGAGFAVLVDESNTFSRGRGLSLQSAAGDPAGTWLLRKAGTFNIGAGSHTVRFFGRQPGARIDGFVLAPQGERITK